MTGQAPHNARSAPPPGIAITGVTHRYGAVTALDDVTLDLPAGTTIGLVGPDGVGKSTLLGLIAGVRRLQSGTVRVLGADMGDRHAREGFLPRTAFMPQGLGRNLYPTLSVWENIDFFARLFGMDARARDARIQRLLDATGLAPFPDRAAGHLSGGMKQKVSLCCALVHDPDLLILDEPTTGVDPLSRQQFWTLVDQLRAERPSMTVIVSTAYMEEAERFSWLVAMDSGRVLVSDRTQHVLERTHTKSLEEAYIALLPAGRRPQEGGLAIPPYTNPGGPPAIEARHLTRRFGSFTAVSDVSFTISRGEIFGFLGSNGCGKSTTMKMLTGLLDVTSGTAELFGEQITAGDMKTRMRIGYMSQAFSLYEELTVRQNLMLQARLYRIPAAKAARMVEQSLDSFELRDCADVSPVALPLGIRQRLQLAAACINNPEILILDEPTSGVDPAARDMFWCHLIRLSREGHVTIFVSTHFMNEAARCDRISLMHRGHVLAVGTPAELVKKRGAPTLEAAFIAYLQDAEAATDAQVHPAPPHAPTRWHALVTRLAARFGGVGGGWLPRAWAFARREAVELLRDRLRLTFALVGPLILLVVAASSISFDVEGVGFTVLDHDRTTISRDLIDGFRGSAYFHELAPVADADALDRAIRNGHAQMALDIPAGFARDMEAGRRPEIGVIIDGAVPFLAANVRAYATGVLAGYATTLGRELPRQAALPITVEPRFSYNQEFRSIYAMTPGVIMLALILIPTMLTALGVVREKEVGSIVNLYASPASVGQYLMGKQAPYVALATLSYFMLVLVAVVVLGVPLKGSLLALTIGGVLFVLSATGLGLLISTFVSSQVAAIFGTSILCLIPAVNFSGLLYPASTLTGASRLVGLGFPAAWYQLISLGCFTKGLGTGSFWLMYLMLGLFAASYMLAARLLLKKQEA
ncbi:ABC transporter ATP-binding protein/permease [Komagataeibacter rhaeticus]|uniref:ribosome-associated ATPase/putative transporter RbbA n=1 Tax=Komagataeibacter rhaeticus TaxID=215221 RepID=UPI000554184F|nr:ribosome-associated ATPase/putative transporter RbbA [Komagataeibacter rhaeticus]MBL7239816.1 ribosome-associated ATPase/putative transporter RbbA [Komagataeibacter rhaeticus]PYD53288.1 ABC transporter ATP-binding protein/permease [Komagataeibacter rhaeticus]GBQ12290.1 multidrug ABC transporter ATP-binding protein [Komagataeibacter rhaeticus DSM 16663]